MARILGVGNATLDIINRVARYPDEDQEVRASAQQRQRGGNVTNTLVVLSQLGHRCHWAGTLAEEPDAALIQADLAHYRVDMKAVHTVASGKVPTSYISLSQENGSRTIVHYRDLPEYPAEAFCRLDLSGFDWLHLEGRNLPALQQMLAHARQHYPQLPCSLEVEKPRAGIEALFGQVDVLMFSRDYVQAKGWQGAEEFLHGLNELHPTTMVTCTWGKQGAYGRDEHDQFHHCPAVSPHQVLDTIGAGDVFNAGLIDQLVRGTSLPKALAAATHLAGKKCGQYGLADLV